MRNCWSFVDRFANRTSSIIEDTPYKRTKQLNMLPLNIKDTCEIHTNEYVEISLLVEMSTCILFLHDIR